MKRLSKILALSLILVSVSFSQIETVGFEFNQHSRYIDSLRTKSNVWLMSYRNELPSDTRFTITLGLDNVKFFENDTTINPMLKSSNQIFAQFEVMQKLYLMYLKAAVQFYSINGNAIEVTTGYSEVLHHNIYRILEFPLGAGFTVPINDFELFLGVNKTFFYGTNEKEIVVNNSGNKTSLGNAPRQSFSTELGLGLEASVVYKITDNIKIEADFIKYKDKDFSLKFSIWGPLKRMLYIN